MTRLLRRYLLSIDLMYGYHYYKLDSRFDTRAACSHCNCSVFLQYNRSSIGSLLGGYSWIVHRGLGSSFLPNVKSRCCWDASRRSCIVHARTSTGTYVQLESGASKPSIYASHFGLFVTSVERSLKVETIKGFLQRA